MSQTTNKNNSFQALRGIAFLSVFLSHCGITKYGFFGVTTFFILSGMLLAKSNYSKELSLSPKSCLKYSVGKIKRLYSLHVIMSFVAVAQVLLMISISYGDKMKPALLPLVFLKLYIKPLIPNFLLIQSWFPTKDIFLAFNGVAWFLSDCLFLYFAFPFLLRILKKYTKKSQVYIVTAVLLIVELLFSLFMHNIGLSRDEGNEIWYWAVYINPVIRCVEFFIGCNIGWLFLKADSEKKLSVKNATVLEILLVAVLVLCHETIMKPKFQMQGDNGWWIVMPFVFTICASFIVVMFGIDRGYIVKFLKNPVVLFLGNISAYAFLIHQPVVEFVKMIPITAPDEALKYIIFIISMAITCAVSYLYQKIHDR